MKTNKKIQTIQGFFEVVEEGRDECLIVLTVNPGVLIAINVGGALHGST